MTPPASMPLLLLLVLTAASARANTPKPPAIPDAARPLPLSAVRLTGGPLKHAQDLDAEYLLKLEPDRMMSWFRKHAGLEPRAKGYGGWDGGGKNLTGHIAGHYLSAVSLMYAATGDVRFKERADYLVAEMKEVQARYPDGYLGALEGGRERFAEVARGDIRSGGFDLNGLWSPWYVLHKIYAGLRDAWRFTGNPDALACEIRFAEWAERVVAGLDEQQMQKMLHTEFGGMNEIFVDLYEDTGDARWLDLSRRFEHNAVLDPLKKSEDRLDGLHGNTQVPKLIGSLDRHALTGDEADGVAARFFWERVVHHHSYATGGHGQNEYFGPADRLSDRVDGRTAETCNVYNMLRMSRRLFALKPDARYAEFHERALFNHILASMDPADGRTSYMVPVGRGVRQEYQDMFEHFTCCVGSGMESHALHGAGIYHVSADRLWVGLYTPSTVDWAEAGVKLTVETDLPEGESVTLRLSMKQPRTFTLSLRRPAWAGEGAAAAVNGEAVKEVAAPGSFLDLAREWKDGDAVRLTLPKALRLEPTPDNPRRAAILWGPLVLAGDLGPEEEFEAWKPGAVPVFVAAERPVSEWLKPVPGKPGTFRTDGVARDRDVELIPFYRMHRRTYAVYWDLFTPSEWEAKSAEYADERERVRKLEAATVAFVQPGEMQPERDFNFQGEESSADRVLGRPARRGRKWFSFDVPVDPAHPMALHITCHSEEWQKRTFDLLIGGVKIGEQVVEKGGPPRFFESEHPIPADLVAGKEKVTVRFQATGGREVAAIFGLRMIRADAPR